MVACAGLFTACSDVIDDVDNGIDNDDSKNTAYLSVSFSMPTAGGSTRATAGEEGDGNEEAVAGEYEISDANVFLFQDDLLKQVITKGESDFGTPVAGAGNVQTVYTTKVPEKVAVGTYKVYIVVNKTDNALTTLPAGTTLATFQEKVFSATIGKGEYCRASHFLMSNAFVVGIEAGQEGVVNITKESTEANPAKVTVTVERAAAKITFVAPTENTMEVKDKSNDKVLGSVLFKSYKVINTRNDAFYLKRVSTSSSDMTPIIGGDETKTGAVVATNYVLENRFAEKTTFVASSLANKWTTEDGFFQKRYSRKYNTYVAWRKLEDLNIASTTGKTLAYCLENTVTQNDQVNGVSTTIIFRAVYTPADGTIQGMKPTEWDGTFYRYPKGSGDYILYYTLTDLLTNIYGDIDEAKRQGALGLTEIMTLDEVNAHLASLKQDVLYTKYSVEEYPQGYCYYTYILRHANNGVNDTRGVMEHVTVRNNIYRLAVTSVGGLGSISSGTNGPTDDDDDPSTPIVPGPGVDEPDGGGTNPEIPNPVDPDGPVEPTTPIIPIDPETPTEEKATFLKVEVKILKWVVRENGMEL